MEPRQGNITLAAAQDKVEIDSRGLDTLAIQVVGSMSATLLAEGTVDGKNWVTLNLTTYGAGLATSITAAGLFFANISGFISVRVRCSAWTSGTPTIAVQAISGGILFFNRDSNGNLLSALGTKLAGEDLTNDVMKVEERFSYSPVATADVQIKSGAGFLHSITISCNDAAPTAGSLIVYDSLTETGTQLFNHTFTTTPFVPFTIFFDTTFSTGLYLGFTTTADVNVVTSYR